MERDATREGIIKTGIRNIGSGNDREYGQPDNGDIRAVYYIGNHLVKIVLTLIMNSVQSPKTRKGVHDVRNLPIY